ncbi:MAG: glycosyltransferase family 39 protein [Planctomycetes bacterium]|nr:glycosyltransferase family 39 protein [Planctomycetota bacterium]
MEIKNKKIFFLFFGFIALSLLIGAFAIAFLPPFPWADQNEYDKIAMTMLESGEYFLLNNEVVLSPGYPFFIAVIYFIFGHSYSAVYIIQFIMLGITACLIYKIGREFLDLPEYLSTTASLAVILWPYFVFFASTLLTETLYILLVTSFIYFLLKFWNNKTLKSGFLAALFLALAAHVRPIPLLLPFWLAVFFLIIHLAGKIPLEKKSVFRYLQVAAIFFALVSPWIIYQSVQKGEIVPMTSSAPNLLEGLYSKMGWEWDAFKTPGYEPGAEITLTKLLMIRVRNIYRFWSPGAMGYQADILINAYPAAKYLIELYRAIFYLIVLLAFSSWFFLKKEKNLILIWLFITYIWSVHIMLHTSPRFTLPVIPLMIILAVYSFYHLIILKFLPKLKNT